MDAINANRNIANFTIPYFVLKYEKIAPIHSPQLPAHPILKLIQNGIFALSVKIKNMIFMNTQTVNSIKTYVLIGSLKLFFIVKGNLIHQQNIFKISPFFFFMLVKCIEKY